MPKAKVFILTSKTRSDKYFDRVMRDVIPSQRNSIVVLEEEAFDVGDVKQATTREAKLIADVVDDADANEDSYMLIDQEVSPSHNKLKRRWEESGKDSSRIYVQDERRILEKFDKVIKEFRFHWNKYAKKQLERFQGQTTKLDDWCGQFFDLKIGYMGRRLSMQIEVIGFGDHSRPFAPRRHESIGQKVLHCYFDDGDHGGSWIGVRDHLGLVTVWFRVLELDYVHQGELLWHIATQTNSVAKLSALH